MESQINRNLKAAKTKERMKAKTEASRLGKEQTQASNTTHGQPVYTEEQIISVFSTGETVEKTPRGAKPIQAPPSNKKNKNKSKK